MEPGSGGIHKYKMCLEKIFGNMADTLDVLMGDDKEPNIFWKSTVC